MSKRAANNQQTAGAAEASRAQLWAHYAAQFVPTDPERDGVAPSPVFALDGIRPSDRVYWQLHVFSEPVPAAWAELAYCYAWAPYGAHVADVSGYDSHPVDVARRAASRHVVEVYLYGEGEPDMCGIPTRRLSWATQQLASSWPGLGVQSVPVEPEIIIVRAAGEGALLDWPTCGRAGKVEIASF